MKIREDNLITSIIQQVDQRGTTITLLMSSTTISTRTKVELTTIHLPQDLPVKKKVKIYYNKSLLTSSILSKESPWVNLIMISDISMQRKSTCQTCGGNKCKPGTAPTRCLSCGGSGTTIYRRGGIVMHLECERCKGIGLMIKYPCLDCKATGVQVQQVVESIVVPPGV